MKIFVLLFLFASAVCLIQIREISENEISLSLAFENVTRHLFQLETRMFINNYGVDSNTMTWLLLESFNKRGMPFKLQNLEIDNNKILFDSSAFLTFDAFKKLRDYNDNLILTNEYYKPLQLFVYCQGATLKEIESLAKDVRIRHPYFVRHSCDLESTKQCYIRRDLEDIIQYEYLLVDEPEFIKLMTFVWFSPKECYELHLVEVNKFNKLTRKWENDKFVFEKLKNFHNCEIRVALLYSNIPQILSKHLNYRIKPILYDVTIDVFVTRGCFDVFDRGITLPDLDGRSSKGEGQNFITWPVQYLRQRLAAPPGGLYNEYEKLLMPFDFFTWALIASTFMAAFLTILILYCVKRSIRDFVIGSNVSTPSLNVIQIFFGISQSVLPRRNFARYLTMLFILFCLIIRTAWQGKMYEFMQKNVTKPEIQTVEQMIEQRYTFYMEGSFAKRYPESEITKRGIIDQEWTNLDPVPGVVEVNFRGVVQSDLHYEAKMAKLTEGRFSERLKEEVLFVKTCGLLFAAHNFIFGIYDLKSQQLFTAGIIQYDFEDSAKEQIRAEKLKNAIAQKPKVLNMHMLEPGFVIWSTSLTLTAIGFLFEWLITLKNYIVFKYILRAFLQM